ncbi:MAG: hypothetical protein PVF17_00410 [Ignavibacteria bacterium]|jgi:hypothetical protein
MKKQSEYSRMKEKVGMHDYMKGRKAGLKEANEPYAGMEPYQKHPEYGNPGRYPMHEGGMD